MGALFNKKAGDHYEKQNDDDSSSRNVECRRTCLWIYVIQQRLSARRNAGVSEN